MRPEDQRWVDGLKADGECFEQTCRELHPLLARWARYEILRCTGHVGMFGPELEDTACQAASDALLLIIHKVDEFRGDSKFTTWAHRFASFEARSKLRRYLGGQDQPTLSLEGCGRLEPSPGPDREAEARDLARAVERVIDTRFTPAQRTVFRDVVLSGDTTEAVAARLGTTVNAVYQAVFRARQSLRDELAAAGFLA